MAYCGRCDEDIAQVGYCWPCCNDEGNRLYQQGRNAALEVFGELVEEWARHRDEDVNLDAVVLERAISSVRSRRGEGEGGS